MPAADDEPRERPEFPWARLLARRAQPPACPEGWSTGPPDFVGVGAHRCGTTRLYSVIVAHPQIVARLPKETHFLDGLGSWDDDQIGRYAQLFPRPPGCLVGEWTPRYLLDPWSPARLASAAPEAKILVSLRDPVERFAAGLDQAVRASSRGLNTLNAFTTPMNVARGQYTPQLRQLMRHYDRAQVHIVQFERWLQDPVGELRRIYAFLGVDPGFAQPGAERGPQPRLTRVELAPRDRAELVAFLRPDVEAVAALVPGLDLALWPNFAAAAG